MFVSQQTIWRMHRCSGQRHVYRYKYFSDQWRRSYGALFLGMGNATTLPCPCFQTTNCWFLHFCICKVQYVYIHCGYTPFRHRYLNNICVLFGVTEALLCCCIAVVVNLQNCRVPSSALIYLLYVQLYIYCISFMSEWAPRDKSKEPMKNWIQLTFSRYSILSTVQLFFCIRLFIECSNNVHMFMHSWASLLLKVTSVKR